MSRTLRIGLFTHSTHPRGGVVHCLELGEALAQLGHDVTVHAPAEAGRGFFRPARRARHVLVPARPVNAGLPALVRQRIQEYVDFLANGNARFDIFHAHDGISGGALAELTAAGLIGGFTRTVHHLDRFTDDYLVATQAHSVKAADRCLCVSRLWKDAIAEQYGIHATPVPNGVNLGRFDPATETDGPLREKLMEGGRAGPFFLAVGGIERRKNTLNILRAFLDVRQSLPRAVLVIAGGASLLDHSEYRREFDQILAAVDDPDAVRSVVVTGAMTDEQMASAYRIADALVFPSVVEGFGLAVLEAMASGTPVITSRLAPFTEYLDDSKAMLVDPHDPQSIMQAMLRVFAPTLRRQLRTAGLLLSRQFSWQASAAAHLNVYSECAGRRGTSSPQENPTMPEMRFQVRWPDDSVSLCYSPSLVIKDFLEVGRAYTVADFVGRSREALTIASNRVKQKYGFACSAAADQLETIERRAGQFSAGADQTVVVVSFDE